MTLVDTSVWVRALRAGEGREAIRLRALLDADEVALAAPVRIEILTGAGASDRSRLRRLLSALPFWYPLDSTWRLVEAWIEPAARAGERFGVVDLLIGALATEHGASIWSLDRDFERMARLDLVTLLPAG